MEHGAEETLELIRALRCLMDKDIYIGTYHSPLATRQKKFALPPDKRAVREVPDRALPTVIRTVRESPDCWRGWIDPDGTSWIYSVEPGNLSWAPDRFTNSSLDFTMLVQWLVSQR